jgi:3-oxoacyl-[acyl-carrier protein] reductase
MTDRQVVLITGTRRGIGRKLAEHFLARGSLVEGCSRQPADWELSGYMHHLTDVTDEAQVKALLTAIQRRHGRLDVVVNNAAIASMNHALLTPFDMVQRIMATNFTGTFLVSREAAKLMMRRRYGRIVNLTTVAVPMRLAGESVYASSKAAVEMLTRVLARELGDLGITCNAVGPSPVDTDLIRGIPKQKIDEIVSTLAVKRLGRFEDVVNVVDFLVRPESAYVTGQVIYLGGP